MWLHSCIISYAGWPHSVQSRQPMNQMDSLIKSILSNSSFYLLDAWSAGQCGRLANMKKYVIYHVLTAMVVKSMIFWDVMPGSLVQVYRHFGGI
jgi:hypothetical protein